MEKKKSILARAVRKFLKEPRTARLTTIGTEGYPHIVPICFSLDGDDIIFGSDDDERKVRNARANPKGAVVIGGEPEQDDAGYMIQGDLVVEADEENSDDEYGDGPKGVIRLKPKKVIRVW